MSHHLHTPGCPDCPYSFTVPVRLKWYEWPLLVLLRRPYRCRTCNDRFFGRYSPVGNFVAMLRDRVL